MTEPEKPYNVNIEFCQVQEYNNNIISVKDVSFSYENKLIFKNLDFGLDTSSRVTLIGKNGAGKSTLLKLVVGEIEPDHGNIIKRSGLRIGYYHQHFEDFLPKDKNKKMWNSKMGLLMMFYKELDEDLKEQWRKEQATM